jgi:hypothetical protein
MPLVLYVLANLIIGMCASLYSWVSNDDSPHSLKGRLLLALFPALGFGYKRYERYYQLGIKPNPLLSCYVLRSLKKFNWWFIGLATIPIILWLVGLFIEEPTTAYIYFGIDNQSTARDGAGMFSDSWGSMLESVGEAIAGVVLFLVLIIPVICSLALLLILYPARRLAWLKRKYRIEINAAGDPVFLH